MTSPEPDFVSASASMPPGINLLQSLRTGYMSDLKLICGDGVEFDVHKVVICSQSDFFDKACTVDMKEKREGIIRISESSDIMQSVLHFCYSGTYEAPADQGIPTANQSVTAEKSLGQQSFHHAQVYEIAVKYGFPSLLDFVVNQWKKDIKSFMQYSPTKGAPLPRLRPGLWSSDAARHEDLKILLDAIFHIYEHEDGVWHHDRIRLLLTEIPWGYKLVFDNKSIWMDFFERTPGYAVDLVARLSLRVTELEDEFKTTKHYECGLCGSIQLMDTHCDAEEDEGYCFYCGEKQSGWHSKEEKDMPTSIQTRLKRYLE